MSEQPAPINRLSIAFQAIEPETGSMKMAFSVRVCFAFTLALYAIKPPGIPVGLVVCSARDERRVSPGGDLVG